VGKGGKLADEDRLPDKTAPTLAYDRFEDLQAPVSRPAEKTSSPRRLGEQGQVEPVPHVVQSGENFWSISRLYYGSGRYLYALWDANRTTVPAPEKLRVNQVIRIPPPEALNASLIEKSDARSHASSTSATAPPPLRKANRTASSSRTVAPASRAEVEVELPAADPFARKPREDDESLDAGTSPPLPHRAPRYKVRKYDTLRSIARDTLGDGHRADEILELNAKVIDDPGHLTIGQELVLPDDARISSRTP
jgi:nucleoid-associated protein YgaU